MSEGIESLWREYESLATATESGASSTLAPWITREQVTDALKYWTGSLRGILFVISGILRLLRPVQPTCEDDSGPGSDGHLLHPRHRPRLHLLQEAERHSGEEGGYIIK